MSGTRPKAAKMSAVRVSKGSRGVTLNGFATKTMRVDELTPADWNPRKMSEGELDKLRKSVKTFGLVEPIVWNEKTGNVVGGHQRLKALMADGIEETDVIVVRLDKREEKQLNIALNRIKGEWDVGLLESLLADIPDELRALTGFDETELDALLNPGLNNAVEEWRGMPEFDQQDKEAFRSIIVHLKDPEAVEAFARLIGQKLHASKKFVWYPQAEIERSADKSY